MTLSMSDLDVLRDIPGYKAILKSVLKMQIKVLLEQLSSQTGEESIILTASVNDGTLSHLGSNTGKGFLEGRDEIKSQFLGYCLKTHHRQKTEPKTPYDRPSPKHQKPPDEMQASKRLRATSFSPIPHQPNLPTSLPTRTESSGFTCSNMYSPHSNLTNFQTPIFEMPTNAKDNQKSSSVKQETDSGIESQTSLVSQKTTSGSEHKQNLGSPGASGKTDSDVRGQSSGLNSGESTQMELTSEQVKIEPISEQDLELEITGVEMAGQPMSADNWDPNQSDSGSQQGSYGYGSTNSQGQEHEENTSDSLECPICIKKLSNKQSLNRHILIHTGDRPYPCQHCDKSFRLRHHLIGHERTVHRLYKGHRIPDHLC